jgi:hypothetical protein
LNYFSQTFSGTYEGFAALIVIGIVLFVIALIAFILIFPIFFVSARLRRKAEDFKNQRLGAVIAQYEPPRNFTPAEIGLLYDMHCGKKELIATLYHLEIRGIIKINTLRKADVLDESAYKLLSEYEKIAIRSVNQEIASNDPPKQMTVSFIDNNETIQNKSFNLPAAKSIREFNQAVRLSLNNKNIPIKSFWLSLFLRAIVIAIIISIIPVFFFASIDVQYNNEYFSAWSLMAFIVAFISTAMFSIFVWPFYLLVGLGIMYFWSLIAGRYWVNTKKARAVWPELEGYKKFIDVVDIDNIQFESKDSQGHYLIETLPYAIVFNLDTKLKELLAKRAIKG